MKRSVFPVVFLVLLLIAPGCRQEKDMPFRIVLSRYFAAVQKDDVKTMASCLTLFDTIQSRYGETGGAIMEFKQKVSKITEDYHKELLKGELTFDPYGIEATHIMGLGEGFYYTTVNLTVSGETATLTLGHSFRYDKLNYSSFPKGTTLFFLSCPAGKLLSVKTGDYQKGYRVLLKKIQTRWYFKKDIHGNWKIEHMEVLKNTAECAQSHRPFY